MASMNCISGELTLIPSKYVIVFSFISLSVSLILRPVLQGVVKLLPLMKITFVTGFGSHQNAQNVLLGENLLPSSFSLESSAPM